MNEWEMKGVPRKPKLSRNIEFSQVYLFVTVNVYLYIYWLEGRYMGCLCEETQSV